MAEDQSSENSDGGANEKVNAATDWSSYWKPIRLFLLRIVFNLALITALVTAAGYFVVHSYLDKITSLYTYKIDPIVYVTSGINMVIEVVGQLPGLFQAIAIGLLIGAIGGLLGEIISFLGGNLYRFILGNRAVQTKPSQPTQPDRRKRDALLTIRMSLLVLLILTVTILISLGVLYGQNHYENSPRYIGGGKPADVILIFSEPEKLATMGLPIAMNPTYPAQSQPVILLMELSDGVLVKDEHIQIPVIIRNDLLYGMVDADPPTASQPVATVLPTLTAATTSTPP